MVGLLCAIWTPDVRSTSFSPAPTTAGHTNRITTNTTLPNRLLYSRLCSSIHVAGRVRDWELCPWGIITGCFFAHIIIPLVIRRSSRRRTRSGIGRGTTRDTTISPSGISLPKARRSRRGVCAPLRLTCLASGLTLIRTQELPELLIGRTTGFVLRFSSGSLLPPVPAVC